MPRDFDAMSPQMVAPFDDIDDDLDDDLDDDPLEAYVRSRYEEHPGGDACDACDAGDDEEISRGDAGYSEGDDATTEDVFQRLVHKLSPFEHLPGRSENKDFVACDQLTLLDVQELNTNGSVMFLCPTPTENDIEDCRKAQHTGRGISVFPEPHLYVDRLASKVYVVDGGVKWQLACGEESEDCMVPVPVKFRSVTAPRRIQLALQERYFPRLRHATLLTSSAPPFRTRRRERARLVVAALTARTRATRLDLLARAASQMRDAWLHRRVRLRRVGEHEGHGACAALREVCEGLKYRARAAQRKAPKGLALYKGCPLFA